MKKIFVLMLVLFVAFSMFAADIDESVAGKTKYVVQFGTGLHYENKGGYDQVDNAFKFQVIAPVHEKVQLGFEGYFNDVLDATATANLNSWSALNNYGKIAVGIVINEKVHVGFYVKGGSEDVKYNEQHMTDGSLPQKTMIGNGFIEASAKLMLKSALFNDKLGLLNVKQGFKVGFMGHGIATNAGGVYVLPKDGTNIGYSGAGNINSTYVTWKYFGEVATEVPIHKLAGWTNISNFTYGVTLAYNLNGFNYSTVEGAMDFTVAPTKLAGEASLENWLKIAPDSSTEFKLTIKPGFSFAQTKWQMNTTNAPEESSSYSKFYTEFGLWGKKSIEVANIMGIVPYFELDAKWTLAYDNTTNANLGTAGSLTSTNTFNSGKFSVDPGVKLGLKFGNWETAIRWNPSATYSIAGTSAAIAQDDAAAASASNVWNLANWDFSVACEFPPPKK